MSKRSRSVVLGLGLCVVSTALVLTLLHMSRTNDAPVAFGDGLDGDESGRGALFTIRESPVTADGQTVLASTDSDDAMRSHAPPLSPQLNQPVHSLAAGAAHGGVAAPGEGAERAALGGSEGHGSPVDNRDTPERREMASKLLERLTPLLRSCYQNELARGGAQTSANATFHVSNTPNIGAVVHSVELDAGVIDPEFATCLEQSIGAIDPFDADGGPGETTFTVPLAFGGRSK